jgi:hypothetical protein
MSKHERLLLKILRGGSDANIPFEDLRQLLLHLGFEEHIRGSHHVSENRESRRRSISRGMARTQRSIR